MNNVTKLVSLLNDKPVFIYIQTACLLASYIKRNSLLGIVDVGLAA